ncbi:DEAD/DEAH box helicase family protein [Aphanothece sacrum]|uniref:DNA 3'-5' helicase n=1 Tax=Aphanothece sacrum FPU1 TaxID=1920663 RepID=A0A401IJK7_APHSA|nr:DEAD/DEAH box helicase family protein [Aphanothece sacrum]GBF81478.1 DNA helicase [Aphanothece sacrum FPU1]GBF85609.1 DNA helicase, Rad25-like protein [Aphanothece sacrum FPU3]
MSRPSKLKYDRGTLIVHPPPKGKEWMEFATWDDRIEKFRVPAIYYRPLIETLQAHNISFIDEAKEFIPLDLTPSFEREPYPHQQEALLAWKQAGRKGVVVLPTAAGKTYLAQLAMVSTPRTTLIVVPTLDLMHQWYAQMMAAFPDIEVGLLGGGSRDRTPILIATYNSGAIHAETLGNQYALLIFDECHHLPTDFFRVIAEYAIAPYRLGLTATPERTDGSHRELDSLIGSVVYRKGVKELSGNTLAQHKIVEIKVKLSQTERKRYDNAMAIRNDFLRKSNISLGSLNGWQLFVKASAKNPAGRRAMLAHREAKEIAAGTDGKLRVLTELICEHDADSILIFTNDNATVYRISQDFLIPAITHQTPIKERHEVLTNFREGIYKALVTSHVLNEGVDVPEVKIAIILSGTGSTREYVQRLGRILRKGESKNKLAILYEIVAENTSEERTSERRRGENQSIEKETNQPQQLELLPSASPYEIKSQKSLKAAESSVDQWGDLEEDE